MTIEIDSCPQHQNTEQEVKDNISHMTTAANLQSLFAKIKSIEPAQLPSFQSYSITPHQENEDEKQLLARNCQIRIQTPRDCCGNEDEDVPDSQTRREDQDTQDVKHDLIAAETDCLKPALPTLLENDSDTAGGEKICPLCRQKVLTDASRAAAQPVTSNSSTIDVLSSPSEKPAAKHGSIAFQQSRQSRPASFLQHQLRLSQISSKSKSRPWR